MIRRIFSQKLRSLLLGTLSLVFGFLGVFSVFGENTLGSFFDSQYAHAQKDGDGGGGGSGGVGGDGGGGSCGNSDGAQVL